MPQDHWRNIGPMKTGKLDEVHGVFATPLFDEDIVQFAAIPADDRLNLAMAAAVCAPRDMHPVLALRTLEEIRFAHGIEIQGAGPKFKPPVAFMIYDL